MGRRLLWTLPGILVGTAAVVLIEQFVHLTGRGAFLVYQLVTVLGLLSLTMAERRGKAPTADEATRPQTLFTTRK